MNRLPDPVVQPVMTVEQAGAAFGLGRSGAYEAARRGDFPTIRLGRRIVVPTAGLRRMLLVDDPVRDEAPAVEENGGLVQLPQAARQRHGSRSG